MPYNYYYYRIILPLWNELSGALIINILLSFCIFGIAITYFDPDKTFLLGLQIPEISRDLMCSRDQLVGQTTQLSAVNGTPKMYSRDQLVNPFNSLLSLVFLNSILIRITDYRNMNLQISCTAGINWSNKYFRSLQ